MIDYQIQPNTRRCAVSGRELQPGERYFSVLLEEAGKFVRKDYADESWQGPPPGAFSFWVGRIAPPQGKRRQPIDDDVLVDCLQRLEGQEEPSRLKFRYVVALLLLRRRRLRLDEVRQEGPREVLAFRCCRTGARYTVVNPSLQDDEIATVQEDVFQALGWV
jgi:recombinational DNA repair protein (RecF pathway)